MLILACGSYLIKEGTLIKICKLVSMHAVFGLTVKLRHCSVMSISKLTALKQDITNKCMIRKLVDAVIFYIQSMDGIMGSNLTQIIRGKY